MSTTASSRPSPRPSPRLDPRAPLVLDTRELPRRPGLMRRVVRTVPAPDGLTLELGGVPAGAPLTLDLRLESVVEGVLVSGTVSGLLTGECGRCLEPLTSSVAAAVQELYAYPAHATALAGARSGESPDDEDEVRRLEGDLLDLEPAVRDAVVLELPLTPLCDEDCAGLCPECGFRLDDAHPADPVHTHSAPIDPRWAALAAALPAPDPSVRSRPEES